MSKKPFTWSEEFQAAKSESRGSFGIAWFTDETEARRYADFVEAKDHRYNGGMMHGRQCGRNREFDYSDKELGRLYAVTHQ